MTFNNLDEWNEQLSPLDRNKKIVALIDELYPDELVQLYWKRLMTVNKSLNQSLSFLSKSLEKGILDLSKEHLWDSFFELDNMKDEMRKLHKLLKDAAFYHPIRDAIRKEPQSSEVKGVPLDRLYDLLCDEKSQKQIDSRRNDLFLTFNRDN